MHAMLNLVMCAPFSSLLVGRATEQRAILQRNDAAPYNINFATEVVIGAA
jgi:hypothetical protein